jgi:DNA-binding MarR family transcriptional regulator
MATQWLTEQEMKAWLRLNAVVELLPSALDAQMRRDAGLTHFEYFALGMLSEAPDRTLRMTELAAKTNATLARLSHVVRRMADRGLVDRVPCPGDGRATNVRLTETGRRKIEAAAPGHVATARTHVFDVLTPEQVDQLTAIADAMLTRLDPDGIKLPGARRVESSGAPPS